MKVELHPTVSELRGSLAGNPSLTFYPMRGTQCARSKFTQPRSQSPDQVTTRQITQALRSRWLSYSPAQCAAWADDAYANPITRRGTTFRLSPFAWYMHRNLPFQTYVDQIADTPYDPPVPITTGSVNYLDYIRSLHQVNLYASFTASTIPAFLAVHIAGPFFSSTRQAARSDWRTAAGPSPASFLQRSSGVAFSGAIPLQGPVFPSGSRLLIRLDCYDYSPWFHVSAYGEKTT